MNNDTILCLLIINVAVYFIGRLFGSNSGYTRGYITGVTETSNTYKKFFASLGSKRRDLMFKELTEFIEKEFKLKRKGDSDGI